MIGTALPMALRWQWLMRAQGMEDTFAWLTRAYFVSYTASQVLPTSIGGDAMRVYETARRHPGPHRRRHGDHPPRTRPRRRGHRAARRDRLRARARHLRRRRLPVARGGVRARHARPDLPLLRALGEAACSTGLRRSSAGLRVEQPLRALYDGVHHFRGHAGLLLGVFLFTTAIQAVRILSIWAAGRAVGIDLGPQDLLRDGTALLPRPPRPVHAQRDRGARGVLRQLPRKRRCPGRPGLCGRLPVLPRHDRPGVAGRRDPALGGLPRRRAADGSSMADVGRVPPASSSPTTRCRGSSGASRASSARDTVVVDNGSSDGTVDLVRERFPEVRLVESENRGLAAGWNRGDRRDLGRARARSSTPTRGSFETPLDRLLDTARAASSRRRRRPAAPQPRRLAPALGAGLPDALAARDRVPLPAEARAALARSSTRSTGRVRPRRRAHGRVGDGRLHARPPRRVRGGRPLRRATTSSSARRSTG